MKKSFRIIQLSLVAIVLIFSTCKKDSSSSTAASMSAKLDGIQFETALRVTVLEGGIFTITGTSLTNEIIALVINGDTEGTYKLSAIPPLAQFGASYMHNALASYEETYIASQGEVVITELDTLNKKISGTFTFDAARVVDFDVLNVTQGKFNNLSYTVVPTDK